MTSKYFFRTPNDNFHYFFGYYDKSPISADGQKLLAHRVDFIDRLPTKKDFAVIGYFDFSKNKKNFIPITKTYSFNWQQGSMLQWLGPDFNSKIIFNNRIDNKFCSQIIDLRTNYVQTFNFPVYAVSSSGKFALCLDYERLYWSRPGYSYPGVVNTKKRAREIENDGIFKLDLESGNLKLIVSTSGVISTQKIDFLDPNFLIYLEHIQISPDESKFAFLFRAISNENLYTKLFISDMNGRNLNGLINSGRLTHYCWRGNEEILSWSGKRNFFNAIRRENIFFSKFFIYLLPIYKKLINLIKGSLKSRLANTFTGDGYYLINLTTKKMHKINSNLLIEDGHPSFNPKRSNILITDTYPNKEGNLKLILYNLESNVGYIVDTLKSIIEYDNSALRCDLHPKWSFCGNFLAVDTMNENKRSIYVYLMPKSQYE